MGGTIATRQASRHSEDRPQAVLPPAQTGRFHASPEGKPRQAIDWHEGDELDGEALKALVRAAVSLNQASAGR